jgi:cell division protein ZapD
MPSYDYPFNERIRALLRIEDLLGKIITNIESNQEHHHFLALQTLLQLVDVIDRAEVKLDLLQELSRQKNVMLLLKDKKVIAADKIDALVNDIDSIMHQLQSDNNKLGQHLRINEWLMNIKQRITIPGGISKFDLPSFQYWLSRHENKRRDDLNQWIKPLLPMQQAVYIILHILRGSGKIRHETAVAGVFHQLLGSAKPSQMLTVLLPENASYYPEVSANKYAINIRFHQLDALQKPQKFNEDVKFNLILCNL